MSGENPCNICHADCENALGEDESCIFHMRFNKTYQCAAYKCMANYEGTCLLDLYDDCGCRRYFDDKL